MKELSIEEKAKRYDEASKWMEGIYPTLTHEQQGEAEAFFPIFKESEDEKVIRDIKVVLESSATKFFKEEGKMPIWYDRAVAWLEKQGEQKSSWSEEDEKMFRTIISDGIRGAELDKAQIDWFKSLKDRVQPQPKQEWSVEDRSKVQRICKYLNEGKKYHADIEVRYADIIEVRECIDWLKALIPQNT